MSHLAKIELEIKDLEDLKKACCRLGAELDESQKSFRSYGRMRECECAIRVPGATYELGVVKEGKSYRLLWDPYTEGGLEAKLGKGAGKLKQAYAVERIRRASVLKGYHLSETRVENSIRLQLTVI